MKIGTRCCVLLIGVFPFLYFDSPATVETDLVKRGPGGGNEAGANKVNNFFMFQVSLRPLLACIALV